MTAGRVARAELSTASPGSKGVLAWAGLTTAGASGRLARLELTLPGSMTADAGTPQSDLEPYTTVTLTGSDAGGSDPITRKWRQISGPTVTLTNADTATATFIAPGTIAGASLVFGYKVSDDGWVSSPEDTVQCDVLPVTERAVVGGVEVPLQILVAAP